MSQQFDLIVSTRTRVLSPTMAARALPDATQSKSMAKRLKRNSFCSLAAPSRYGKSHVFEADLVIHAAARKPALQDLNLEAAGIETEHGRLKLNEYLQSVSHEGVYAAGDAAQNGPPLTPVAAHDAKVAAANILEGNHQEPDYRGVPLDHLRVKRGKLSATRSIRGKHYQQAENEGKKGLTTLRFTGQDN